LGNQTPYCALSLPDSAATPEYDQSTRHAYINGLSGQRIATAGRAVCTHDMKTQCPLCGIAGSRQRIASHLQTSHRKRTLVESLLDSTTLGTVQEGTDVERA
jgi:hypothetical protein